MGGSFAYAAGGVSESSPPRPPRSLSVLATGSFAASTCSATISSSCRKRQHVKNKQHVSQGTFWWSEGVEAGLSPLRNCTPIFCEHSTWEKDRDDNLCLQWAWSSSRRRREACTGCRRGVRHDRGVKPVPVSVTHTKKSNPPVKRGEIGILMVAEGVLAGVDPGQRSLLSGNA